MLLLLLSWTGTAVAWITHDDHVALLDRAHGMDFGGQDQSNVKMLSCRYDPNANVYNEKYVPYQAWGGGSVFQHEVNRSLKKLGLPDLWKRQDYTSMKVLAQHEQLLDVLKEFSERINIPYWLLGGGLIGVGRHKSLVPWDRDLDFCIPNVSLSIIEAAYAGVEKIKLGNMTAMVLESSKHPGEKFLLVYSAQAGSVSLILYAPGSGSKAEMVTMFCGKPEHLSLGLPVRRIEVGNTTANIPRFPMQWLQKVDAYREVDNATMVQGIGFTCEVCSGFAADDACPVDDLLCSGRNVSGSFEQYIFESKGSKPFDCKCRRQEFKQLSNCKPSHENLSHGNLTITMRFSRSPQDGTSLHEYDYSDDYSE